MKDGKTISIVIPAFNEQNTIAQVVRDFHACKEVDEVLVVNNNSLDQTALRATEAGARVVNEQIKGYGSALFRGMKEAKGDWIVLVEADGTFAASDLDKFFCYMNDCDMVVGTRTTRQMSKQASHMGIFVRWGNVFAAKLIELLWYVPHEPRLTDVGCTYRLLSRETFQIISPGLSEKGPGFSPEMICEAIATSLRVIEIPIYYLPRIAGKSNHSNNLFRLSLTAMKMFRVIFSKRLTSLKK